MPRLRTFLAFAAGAAFALPLATRPSFLGPTCSRTGPAGAVLRLEVVSATRGGVAVPAPAGFTPYLQNTSSADASRLQAVFMDAGDRADDTAFVVDRIVRRLP